jgi:hypothetical protein
MKLNKCVLVIGCLLIILFSIFISKIKGLEDYTTSSKIPKIIWTFWDGEPSVFINKCIKTWKKFNPDHEVNVLNKTNIKKYLPDINFTSLKHVERIQRYSDIVRLNILSKYGGIWMDASIICQKSFNWIHDIQNKTGCEFIGYYIDGFTIKEFKEHAKVIESWFFACIPKSKIMVDWSNEFMKIQNYNKIGDYLDSVKSENVNFQNIPYPDYLTIHVSVQKILQKNKNKYNLHLLKAEDTAFSFMDTSKNPWDEEAGITSLLNKNHLDQPILKLTSNTRKIMEGRDYNPYFEFLAH